MTATARNAPEQPVDSAALPTHIAVAIVGSGFGGLAAAIRLRETGRDVIVLERSTEVGGTWRDNSYPGCACDVPSHLYSLSYAPNPDWTRAFSSQPEIWAYLQRTAKDFGVLPHIRFGAELLSARWDRDGQCWRLDTTRGALTANFLVTAAGPLSEPTIPELPGLASFGGTVFHSATWDHGHDLAGKRVAVIGTGASAIQFVPHVQRAAAHLTLFQRTPPWILPRRDRAITPIERRLYRLFPKLQKAVRAGIYWGRESWIVGFSIQPRVMALGERVARRWLRKQVADCALRAKLTPGYRLGCKRVLLSNDYYPALCQPNVEVVTDRIVEVRPHAVVCAEATGGQTEHLADTIIFGTGFRVTEPPIAARIYDADGQSLAQHWSAGGMAALHGLTVAGFPNMFFLAGPNTGLGHTSVVLMIEAQVGYLLDALAQLDARGLATLEPKRTSQDAYNRQLQANLTGTVWNSGGCASWYLDARGRNTTLWPTFATSFRRVVARCDLADYLTERATAHSRSGTTR